MKNSVIAPNTSKVLATIILLLVSLLVFAQTQPQTASKRVLLVSIPDRKLAVVENGTVMKIYLVAVGKVSAPSPTDSASYRI
jgi:murein L,D-transpeptidase YcbB/YkuD